MTDAIAWTALPAIQLRFNLRSSGRDDVGWHGHCLSLVDRDLFGRARMLVLTGNSDWLQRELLRRNACDRCDAANADAELPAGAYDVVWCEQTLCHSGDLDAAVARIARALRPGGTLFAFEYVGPDLLAIGRAQRTAVRAAFSLIPSRFRISARTGVPLAAVALPGPPPNDGRTIGASARIVRTLRERFDLTECRPLGGTLLQYVLKDIAANFLAGDAAADAVLHMLFAIEDALIDTGELESDFMLIAAKPK